MAPFVPKEEATPEPFEPLIALAPHLPRDRVKKGEGEVQAPFIVRVSPPSRLVSADIARKQPLRPGRHVHKAAPLEIGLIPRVRRTIPDDRVGIGADALHHGGAYQVLQPLLSTAIGHYTPPCGAPVTSGTRSTRVSPSPRARGRPCTAI